MSDRLKAQLNLLNLSAAYKTCFCNPDGTLTKAGQRVMRDLAHYAGLYHSPVRVSPISRTVDPLASMVAAGRAEVVRRAMAYIELDPTTTQLMKDDDQ